MSKVFVKSLARADAALNAVIRNSRWPGGSKLFWGLFAGEACGSEVIVETISSMFGRGGLHGVAVSFWGSDFSVGKLA